MKQFILLSLLLSITLSSFSQRRANKEYVYQKEFASVYLGDEVKQNDSTVLNADEYVLEYLLDDRTRVDILTSEYAIEVDFANKWYNGVGQSLHYAIKTGKKPAMLLILENPSKDDVYLERLKVVAMEYDIKLYFMTRDFKTGTMTKEWISKNL